MKKGDQVRINSNCNNTKCRYGINDHMLKIRGTIHMIKSISGNMVFLEKSDWQWHIKDLILIKNIEQVVIPVGSFDPENLIMPEEI